MVKGYGERLCGILVDYKELLKQVENVARRAVNKVKEKKRVVRDKIGAEVKKEMRGLRAVASTA
jgi:hypothetical protein